MVVTVIIIILAGLIFVAVATGLRTAREATERQFVRNISTGVEQFKQAFKFYPPLVDDTTPLDTATKRILVQGDTGDGGLAALQYLQNPAQPRFSERSLPIFLAGVLGQEYDGVEGSGFLAPQPDGQFAKSGPRTDPFLDTSRDAERLARTGGDTIPAYRDRWNGAIRYYRWEPTKYPKGHPQFGETSSGNAPVLFGDPAGNAKLRDGGFAIVSAGRNQRIANSPPTADDNLDNIVELAQ